MSWLQIPPLLNAAVYKIGDVEVKNSSCKTHHGGHRPAKVVA